MGNALRLGIARIGLAVNQWRANRKNLKKTIVILILGLQGVGKSTIALRLWKLRKSLPDPTYVQTKGFDTYEIKKRNLTIKINDLGGHESVRELWSHYYADAHGVIFVVDSSKPEELVEAGAVLAEVLRDERIMRKPVLVLANKQDDPRAVSEVDLTRSMDLVTIVNSVRCLTRVDLCAANNLKMDQGIFNGHKWLVTFIQNHYAEIDARVQHDSLMEREREKRRFNMARDQARQRRQEEAAVAAANNEPVLTPANHENKSEIDEYGIDQVQKPVLCTHSLDGEVDEPELPPFKPVQGEIPERPSPEGAADSAEDLKYIDPKTAFEKQSTNNNNNNNGPPTPASPNVNQVPLKTNSNIDGRPQSNANLNNHQASANVKKQSTGKSRQKVGTENLAFEATEDDKESLRHRQQLSSQLNGSKHSANDFQNYKLMRYRASSIRSNSTETDIDIPGEIIMVTTKAEVHESQEMLDDIDVNSNPKLDRTGSPSLSIISGHISHKTSMESINFSLGNEADSTNTSAGTGKNRSRSSSTGRIYDKDVNTLSARSNHQPSAFQKLTNIKNRNKTAPLADPKEAPSQVNGSAVSSRTQTSTAPR